MGFVFAIVLVLLLLPCCIFYDAAPGVINESKSKLTVKSAVGKDVILNKQFVSVIDCADPTNVKEVPAVSA